VVNNAAAPHIERGSQGRFPYPRAASRPMLRFSACSNWAALPRWG